MGDFSTTEHYGCFYLVTTFQKSTSVFRFEIKVVFFSAWLEPKFLQLLLLLVLTLHFVFFGLLVLVFTVVNYLDYRWLCIWRYFYQIQPKFFGFLYCGNFC